MTFTKAQLDAMRADAGWLRAGFRANTAIACADHVDELVAEVERLTAELAYSHAREQAKMDSATERAAEIDRLRALHAEIVSELYGKGFDVLGWHLNGAVEQLDSWFEDNGWCDADTWEPTVDTPATGG
jgi:hypothetical protein